MIGKLLLRATVGGFFVGHGTQKLFGWFGGHGLNGTGQFFESLGLRPGKVHATAAGAAEAGGGALLALGYQTPLASAALIGTMLTAINRVHLKNGPWVTEGGFEYNAVLIAAAVALAEAGPGPLSLDAALGKERSGIGWGLASLAAGAAGAAAAHAFAESQAGGSTQEPAAGQNDAASAVASSAETPASSPATGGSSLGVETTPSTAGSILAPEEGDTAEQTDGPKEADRSEQADGPRDPETASSEA